MYMRWVKKHVPDNWSTVPSEARKPDRQKPMELNRPTKDREVCAGYTAANPKTDASQQLSTADHG
jgi:hypothetical protein